MQTTQLVSSALRALGFEVYDGAARVVEGSGDPKAQQMPATHAKPGSPGSQPMPVPQQQQDGALTGAGAGLPANARREGDPEETSVSGTVPTGSAVSPDVSSSSMGEVGEQGDQGTHRSDSAGDAPPAPDVSLTLGELSHMLCFVRLEDTLWLVDCGFGGSAPTQPVAIDGGINIIDAAQVTGEERRCEQHRISHIAKLALYPPHRALERCMACCVPACKPLGLAWPKGLQAGTQHAMQRSKAQAFAVFDVDVKGADGSCDLALQLVRRRGGIVCGGDFPAPPACRMTMKPRMCAARGGTCNACRRRKRNGR